MPLEINSVDLGGATPALMIKFTNGISASVEAEQLTLYFAPSNTLTAWFDPHSKKLCRTLLEIAPSQSVPGQWVRDLNADGVPDLRKTKGGGAEVFYDGHWYPCKPGNGTNTLITVNGKQLALYCDNGVWKEPASHK